MGSRRLLLLIPILLCLGNLEPTCAQVAPPQRGFSEETSEPSSPEEHGPYYALVIGINDYDHLTKLSTALNDAKEVAKVLREQYGFETTLLPNADRHEILSALDNYRRTLPNNANLLIYYAGHGFYDRDMDKAYWAPVEAEKDTYADWIIADEITSRAKAIPARHILIVSDSCYSGMIGATREDSPTMTPVRHSVYLDKMLRKKSRGVISSGGNEPVTDAGAQGHSLFAYAFLQGLSQIEEYAFTADELFHRFVKVQVAGKSNQVPGYDVLRNSGDDFGDFLFFRLPATTKPQPAGGGGKAIQPKELLAQAKALSASGAYGSAYPLFKQAAEGGSPEAMLYVGLYFDSRMPAYAGSASKDDRAAARWYRKAADGGEPWGMTNLGGMYENGIGVEKDYAQAIGWFHKAAEAGNTRGMSSMGWLYETGNGVGKDFAQAMSWYRKAAEAGDAAGMNNLGWMYENGEGVKKDPVQALSWFGKSAEAGYGAGMTSLGWAYETGNGAAKDTAQAMKWYRKGAEAGDATGMNNLGRMYENAIGVEKDYTEAANWYRKAAEAGDPLGMNNLGLLYENGKGLEKNYTEAASWYRKAAERGEPWGMNNLGVMYENGTGVEKDYAQAMDWFRKAVEAGNARGMSGMGWLYETGNGVEKDYAQAMSWYRKAVEAGDVPAMSNLGFMYENGEGVEKDRAQAVSWYRKAAAAGNEYALKRLKELGEDTPTSNPPR